MRTIARHVSSGDVVHVVIACEGESVRYSNLNQNLNSASSQASSILGVDRLHFLEFPDQQLDTLCLLDINKKLGLIIDSFMPTVVYTHSHTDINSDHKILFDSVLVCARPTNSKIHSIYSFETASSTEWGFPRSFQPDTWINIEPFLSIKLEAMKAYISECRSFPHPRSIDSLVYRAKYFGSQVLQDSCEVFQLFVELSNDYA